MDINLNDFARIFFTKTYFYFLFINILLILFLFVKRRAVFLKELKKINKFHLLLVFIAFLIAFYFRSHYFRDGIAYKFFTEQFSVANSFYYDKQAFICNAGKFSACDSNISPIHPNGFAFLVYLFFVFLGNSFSTYTLCASLVSSLTVLAVYFLAVLLFKDSQAGVIASFIFAFLSEHIRITDSRAVIAGSILFIIISLITLLVSLKNKRDNQLYLLSFLTLFFCANMRYENIILLCVFFVAYLLYRPADLKYSTILKYLFISFIISLPLFVFHIFSKDALISILGKQAVLGGSFNKLSLNIRSYYNYLSSAHYFCQPLYLFALLGIFVLFLNRNYRKVLGVMLSWIFVYCIIYLFHKNIGYHRYAMHLFPQYVLLISLGVSYLIHLVHKLYSRIPNFKLKDLTSNLLLVVFIVFISFKLIGLINPRHSPAAVDYSDILSEVKSNDYVILDDTNSMVFLRHNFVIFNYNGYDKRLLRSKLEKGSDIYLLAWEGMCEYYNQYKPCCTMFFRDFSFVELKKSGRYILYKLDRSKL